MAGKAEGNAPAPGPDCDIRPAGTEPPVGETRFHLKNLEDKGVVHVCNQIAYYNANIYTMDPQLPRASAVAVMDERILAVGTRAQAESALCGPYDIVDLRGLTMVPGFTDCHIHLLWYALALRQLNLEGASSIREIARRVAERSAQTGPGEWILGNGWSRGLWHDSEIPTCLHLDSVSPANPVALTSKDGHTKWVNSLALTAAGMNRGTPDPDGGRIERDPHSGEPTGLLCENAQTLIERVIPTSDLPTCEDAIARAVTRLHEFGVVGIHDCEGELSFRAFQNLASKGRLGLRVLMMIPRSNLDAAIQVGLQTGLGDPNLRIGPLKVFADGALGSKTAALLEPYVGDPGNVGITVTSREELTEVIARASQAGIAVAVHAIGDRANRNALDAFEESASALGQKDQPAVHHAAPTERRSHMARATGPGGSNIGQRRLRHRIEHAQLVHPDDLQRFKTLGIVASVQPVHSTSDRYMADRHWGERISRGYAYRSLEDSGARLAFGSDGPVETPDPIAGIFAAVTRKRADEVLLPGWQTEECLSVDRAVRGYTSGAAYASGEEAIKGSISPGKLADFVVLSKDIFSISPDEITQAEVLATVVGGQVVFDRVGLTAEPGAATYLAN